MEDAPELLIGSTISAVMLGATVAYTSWLPIHTVGRDCVRIAAWRNLALFFGVLGFFVALCLLVYFREAQGGELSVGESVPLGLVAGLMFGFMILTRSTNPVLFVDPVGFGALRLAEILRVPGSVGVPTHFMLGAGIYFYLYRTDSNVIGDTVWSSVFLLGMLCLVPAVHRAFGSTIATLVQKDYRELRHSVVSEVCELDEDQIVLAIRSRLLAGSHPNGPVLQTLLDEALSDLDDWQRKRKLADLLLEIAHFHVVRDMLSEHHFRTRVSAESLSSPAPDSTDPQA